MDLFTERLVPKKWETKDIALCVASFLAALIISAAAFLFVGGIAIVITAGAFYGAYYVSSGFMFVEYEYIVTNEEFDIDKIIAKRKRIRLKSYSIKEFTAGGKYSGGEGEMLCPDKNSENLYFLEKAEGGVKERIVIDPNETMLKAFELYMGAKFKR